MIKRLLISWLFKLLFRGDYIQQIDIRERLIAFKRINDDERLMKLFRSLYTRAYQSLSFNWSKGPSDYEMGVYTGRVIELGHIIDMAERAQGDLDNLKKIEQRKKIVEEITSRVGRNFRKVGLVIKPW